jgi:hypothetical protein
VFSYWSLHDYGLRLRKFGGLPKGPYYFVRRRARLGNGQVDLARNEQYDPDYLKLNPAGVVPTLVHNGEPVLKSTLICEYLEETFPESLLVPRDPGLRMRMRLWTKAADEGLHEGVSEISFSAMFRELMKSMPGNLREAYFRNIGDPRRRDRFKSTLRSWRSIPVCPVSHCCFRASLQDIGGDARGRRTVNYRFSAPAR